MRWEGGVGKGTDVHHRGGSKLYCVPTRQIMSLGTLKTAAVRKEGAMVMVVILYGS